MMRQLDQTLLSPLVCASRNLCVLAVLVTSACTSGTGSSGGEPETEPEGEPEGCVIGAVELGTVPGDAAVDESGNAPDLSCIGNPRVVTGSSAVTIEGCVDIFGLGSKAENDLQVAIFDIAQDPSVDTPAHGVHEIETDTEPGDLQTLAQGCESKGYYRAENIPTHTSLIFKVFDPVVDVGRVALNTYTYDVVLYDEDAVGGVVYYEANLIYNSTIETIVPLAGRPIEGSGDINDNVGRGSVAGEVHDCADRKITNAIVGTSNTDNETGIAYFDGQEDAKPSPIRQSTNTDALYALLNVITAAGNNSHTLAAGIMDADCTGEDCMCVSMGTTTIKTFPDSVSIATFRGPPPTVQ